MRSYSSPGSRSSARARARATRAWQLAAARRAFRPAVTGPRVRRNQVRRRPAALPGRTAARRTRVAERTAAVLVARTRRAPAVRMAAARAAETPTVEARAREG